jgi:hypothetical protein
MTLARLLAAALLCALPALSQDQQSQSSRTSNPLKFGRSITGPINSREFFFFNPASIPAPRPSKPWMILSNPPATPGSLRSALEQMRLGQYNFSQLRDDSGVYTVKPRSRTFRITPLPDGQLADDTTCLTMRSYVVARDSKDSDSTHLVSYSTCQPAARYRVKTTEMRSVSPDH